MIRLDSRPNYRLNCTYSELLEDKGGDEKDL